MLQSRFASIVLVAAVLIGILPSQAFAEVQKLEKRLKEKSVVGEEINLKFGTHKKATKFEVEKGPSSISISYLKGIMTWTPSPSEVGRHEVVIKFKVKGKTKRVAMDTEVVLPEPAPTTPAPSESPATPSVPMVDSDQSDTTPEATESRVWTSRDGNFTVTATLAGVTGGQAILIRDGDKKRLEVPVGALSESDTRYIANQGRQHQPPQTDQASPPTPPVKHPSPTPAPRGKVAVIKLSDSQVELSPYGRIDIFTDDTPWVVDRQRPPQFTIQNILEGFTLNVLPAARSQAEKRRVLRRSYDDLFTEIARAQFKVTERTVIDPNLEFRAGVQFVATARHHIHGMRHVTTRIRYDDDATFVFQVSGRSTSRVEKLIALSDTFIREQPEESQVANVTPPEMEKPGNPADAPTSSSQPGTPALVGVKTSVSKVTDQSFRLEPFGVIGIPGPGFSWRVDPWRVCNFVCESKDKTAWIKLSVSKPIEHNEEAWGEFNRKSMERRVAQVESQGGAITDMIDRCTDANITDAIGYEVHTLENDQRIQHSAMHVFRPDHTYLFETRAPVESPIEAAVRGTVRYFLTDSDAKKMKNAKIPSMMKEGLSKEIALMEQLLDMKTAADVEKMIEHVMGGQQLQALKDSGNFDQVSQHVLKETGPILLSSVKAIDWSRAQFDQIRVTIFFPVPPHGAMFHRVNGEWRLRLE